MAFLGGLIRWLIEERRYFRDYVVAYTNAATLVNQEFHDTEELDGVFSGLRPKPGGPADGLTHDYALDTWRYADPPASDPTLEDPRCVFQIVRRHYARYTPEMVERITGCAQATFLQVARMLAENSTPERTTAFCYAVGWTQHIHGPQMISCCALLQLLLGNIGRPGGGILALRGHASIQGSTDIPTLYHSIHGYMRAPDVRRKHQTLADYLAAEKKVQPRGAGPERVAAGYWAHLPRFMVSYLKSMYGAAATKENDFGYAWHPRISGDLSHLPTMLAMADGQVKGMLVIGQNPAVGGQNARLQRRALGKLAWLVVKDNFETETASFWYAAPEVKRGEVKAEDIATEVFFFPSAQVGETEGSFTNTQRWVQWHSKAAEAPGDCRSDPWFTHGLAKRLKALYAGSDLPRDQGFKNLTWDFDPDGPGHGSGEPDIKRVAREINGFETASGALLKGFSALKDDGSTTCASWIYCGMFPAPDKLLPAQRNPDPRGAHLANNGWAWSWPANRRVLYNRASARPDGTPWSERKKWIWWDGARWSGEDVPDFTVDKAPGTPAIEGGTALEGHSGSDPFVMMSDGKGWLFAPEGLVDGPLPVHYEPAESPVGNALHPKQATSPMVKRWDRPDNVLAATGDPRFPFVLSTYRLTEHHLTGVMSRWLPWLAELQPELFVELSPELAQERGIVNRSMVRVSTPRGSIVARALVTRRCRPLTIDGRVLHQVGLPWHWGYMGVVTGDVVNDLTAIVAEPNVSIHEAKCFVCDVAPAGKDRGGA